MFPLVSVAQMRRIDEATIGGDTAAGYSYMVKAGGAIKEAAVRLLPNSGAIAVVCGKGNNGGDGYVAARLLMDAGYQVTCFSVCAVAKLAGEAAMAYREYVDHGGTCVRVTGAATLQDLSRFGLIIDAILGSGLVGSPHGLAAVAITAINNAGVVVLAVDTPSGLDNDTGQAGDPCVRATTTVTLGFPKIGACFYPGRSHVAMLEVRDLGYPADIVAANHSNIFYPTAADLSPLLPVRRPAGSKFDHGVALMLCGSRGMLGSATLACSAALRSGCGMVHAVVPAGSIDTLSVKLTETVLHAVAETAAGSLASAAAATVRELAGRAQSLCIGPGLSTQEETARLVRALVSELSLPCVLDADGLNAYRGHAADFKGHAGPLVITPHAGEWQRLFGPLPTEPLAMIASLRKTAVDHTMTILYKGNPSLVAAADGRCFVLPVGNSGMATAGAGDVLSGIIAGLLAQGAEPTDAALLGAWLHGAAGDAAATARTEYCLIASDIVEHLPHAFRRLLAPAG